MQNVFIFAYLISKSGKTITNLNSATTDEDPNFVVTFIDINKIHFQRRTDFGLFLKILCSLFYGRNISELYLCFIVTE